MTAVIENVNKMSKYGLRRRPTYEEITNVISENEKLTGTLPNRDATFSEIHQREVCLMGVIYGTVKGRARKTITEANVRTATEAKCKNSRKDLSR